MKNILLTISLILVVSLTTKSFATIDSVGNETVDGKMVILHKVDPKETLYSISRKYGVAVATITAANPGSEMGIGIGQIIKIPTTKTVKQGTATPAVETVIENNQENKFHTVKPGETLYAISTLYPCSVDDIKKWNGLSSNALDVGQKLIIGKVETVTAKVETPVIAVVDEVEEEEEIEIEPETKVEEEEITESKEEVVEQVEEIEEKIDELKATTTDGREIDIDLQVKTKQQVEEEKKQDDLNNTEKLLNSQSSNNDSLPSKRSVDMGGYIKEYEKGYAVLMEGTATDERYLAHHRTLPEGTILQIRNLENDKSVFVRIVGVFEHDDPKVIISLSTKAEIRLKSENTTFLTEISYIP